MPITFTYYTFNIFYYKTVIKNVNYNKKALFYYLYVYNYVYTTIIKTYVVWYKVIYQKSKKLILCLKKPINILLLFYYYLKPLFIYIELLKVKCKYTVYWHFNIQIFQSINIDSNNSKIVVTIFKLKKNLIYHTVSYYIHIYYISINAFLYIEIIKIAFFIINSVFYYTIIIKMSKCIIC
jgi:hypothetical protein